MAIVTYRCPACRKKVIASVLLEGTTNDCPACGKEIEVWPAPVPTPPAPAASAPDGSRPAERKEPAAVVRLPALFHVAAWLVILTCLAILSGVVTSTVRVSSVGWY